MNKECTLIEKIYKDAAMGRYSTQKLMENLKGKDNKITDDVEEIFEGYSSFESYIYNSGNYEDLINETETEWREWYKDEYAYSEAERILYEALEREEHYLEACGG